MTIQRTFTDIEEARLCFTEYVRFHKRDVMILGEDNSIHIEFDDITDECDPEMIETWSMKDEATDETGCLINSSSCELVCKSTIKPKDSDTEDEEDECPFCKGEKCNLSHPPYFCDNGCGKIVGCGVDDECVRTCSCDS